MTEPGRKACIVGIGETDYAKRGGIADRSEFQLACQAILAAAADAGLPVEAIDGFASFNNDPNVPNLLQAALGIPRLRFAGMPFGGGGGGSCGGVALAQAAVESGKAETVAVFRSLCQGQARRYGQHSSSRLHGSYVHPFGLFAPPQMMALIVQRYLHETGTTIEQMAEVSLICRDNATRNPRAVMRRPMTLEDYLASRFVAEPLRLFDCCLESDGACAVIVTTRERARDLDVRPVDILAAVQGCDPGFGTGPLGSHNMPAGSYTSVNAGVVARDLYGQADLKPEDIDVAQFYDHFSGMVLIGLEDYGFCARGEAGAFLAAGHGRWPSGRLPINTAGGNLSEAYIIGFNHVLEGVRQLRGQSSSQVEGARTCLVTGGAAAAPSSALVLAT